MPEGRTVFLLSPADCGGKRAGYLLGERGRSDLALRLRSVSGAALGEVYTFMSGLYFRGKLAYARAFAGDNAARDRVLVITPGLGLCDPDTLVDLAGLRVIAAIPIDPDEPGYANPLRRDAALLAGRLAPGDRVVLLGSIATSKYLEPLGAVLGRRLMVPGDFVGLGDMSRGALLLRCVAEQRELTYVEHAVAHVSRPAPRSPRAPRARSARRSS